MSPSSHHHPSLCGLIPFLVLRHLSTDLTQQDLWSVVDTLNYLIVAPLRHVSTTKQNKNISRCFASWLPCAQQRGKHARRSEASFRTKHPGKVMPARAVHPGDICNNSRTYAQTRLSASKQIHDSVHPMNPSSTIIFIPNMRQECSPSPGGSVEVVNEPL